MKKLSILSSNITASSNCTSSQQTKFRELVDNLSSGSFINMSNTSLCGKQKRYSVPLPVMDKNINALDENDVLMELIKDISNELDINILCHKILRNVSLLTNSDRGSLFLSKGTKEEPILISNLYDVTEKSTLKESLHTNEHAIIIPFGKGIAGHVAATKEPINIKNAYEDKRFNPDVDKRTGYRTYAILCMPIMNYEGEVVGVAQIINKKSGQQEFTPRDQEVFRKYLIFCGIGIQNARLFQISIQEYKRNKLLLQLARNIFEQQNTLDQLVPKIMRDTQEIIKADCSIYIIHKDYTLMSPADLSRSTEIHPIDPAAVKGPIEFSPVFRLNHSKSGEYEIKKLKSEEFQDLPETQIATYVVRNGETLNIHDGKASCSEFVMHKGQSTEPLTSDDPLLHQNILTVPIMNSENIVFGAVQFIQPRGENPFEDGDIGLIQAFALFCGLGINNTSMYENVVKLIAKQNVALEVLSYHATASKEEAHKIRAMNIPSVSGLKLNSFEFDDKDMTDDQTVLASLAMLYHLNLPSIYNIQIEVVTRWLLSVRKNYRDVTYHNWRHAFNVAQVMFCLITTGGLNRIFSNLEILAFMVSCLCHDLDHRGTNNAFMSKAGTSLAKVYGTSTLEHHHFDQCIMILTSPGNQILQALSPSEYKHCIELLESFILATDLAIYFKRRPKFLDLIRKGQTDFTSNPEDHALLSSMMMTACDIAAITKPWAVQKRIGILVAKEFFEQGDIEKEELHIKPLPLMDRDKSSEMPKMQVDFINVVCLPLYEALAKYDPKLEPMLKGVLDNRSKWQKLGENPTFDINEFKFDPDTDSDNKSPDSEPDTSRPNDSTMGNNQKSSNPDMNAKDPNNGGEGQDEKSRKASGKPSVQDRSPKISQVSLNGIKGSPDIDDEGSLGKLSSDSNLSNDNDNKGQPKRGNANKLSPKLPKISSGLRSAHFSTNPPSTRVYSNESFIETGNLSTSNSPKKSPNPGESKEDETENGSEIFKFDNLSDHDKGSSKRKDSLQIYHNHQNLKKLYDRPNDVTSPTTGPIISFKDGKFKRDSAKSVDNRSLLGSNVDMEQSQDFMRRSSRGSSRAKIEPLEILADEENERVIKQCMESPLKLQSVGNMSKVKTVRNEPFVAPDKRNDTGQERINNIDTSEKSHRDDNHVASEEILKGAYDEVVKNSANSIGADQKEGVGDGDGEQKTKKSEPTEQHQPLSTTELNRPTSPKEATEIFSPTYKDKDKNSTQFVMPPPTTSSSLPQSLSPKVVDKQARLHQDGQKPSTSKTDMNYYVPDGMPDAEMLDDYTFPEPPPKKNIKNALTNNGSIEISGDDKKGSSKVHFESLVYKPRNPVPSPLDKLKKKATHSSKVCNIL